MKQRYNIIEDAYVVYIRVLAKLTDKYCLHKIVYYKQFMLKKFIINIV